MLVLAHWFWTGIPTRRVLRQSLVKGRNTSIGLFRDVFYPQACAQNGQLQSRVEKYIVFIVSYYISFIFQHFVTKILRVVFVLLQQHLQLRFLIQGANTSFPQWLPSFLQCPNSIARPLKVSNVSNLVEISCMW